jgi:selenocysteine lyase/cysteine desulfurase
VLGVAGLTAGVQYVEERGLGAIHAHEVGLVERLWRRLEGLGGFEVFGHRDHSRRVGTVSFRSEALPAAELGGILDQAFDIAVRPGLHCAPYVHKALGTYPDGLVRVSPGPFTTEAEIDRLADALKEICA